jgi:hypothetical protein
MVKHSKTALQSDFLPELFGPFLELWHLNIFKENLSSKREFRENRLSDTF